MPRAMTDRGNLLDTSEDLFDRMFAVNVRAPFFLMQGRREDHDPGRDPGNPSSTSVRSRAPRGSPFIAPYCASKGALATLTRNTGFALLRNRIRVNQLDIGWMASDGEGSHSSAGTHGAGDGWVEKAGADLPFGRLLDPAEVARAVGFLASDDSGMMTGAVVHFDQSVWGGCSASPPAPAEAMTA